MRPNKNLIASTTLDIMRGQGMKYAHAISDARQGVEGDLEKSKRQIKRHKETVIENNSWTRSVGNQLFVILLPVPTGTCWCCISFFRQCTGINVTPFNTFRGHRRYPEKEMFGRLLAELKRWRRSAAGRGSRLLRRPRCGACKTSTPLPREGALIKGRRNAGLRLGR